MFANSWPSALNFKSFSQSLEQFFLTVGQNNFGNKILMGILIVVTKLVNVSVYRILGQDLKMNLMEAYVNRK
jgi:hypothetical protein